MSPDDPRKSRSRRRIAGERRPARADESGQVPPDQGSSPAQPPEPPVRRPTGPVGDESIPGADRAEQPSEAGRLPGALGEGPSWLLLGALATLTLLLVATAAVLGLGVWHYGEVKLQERVDEATREAPAVAERASEAILSYGYTSLDADEKAAKRYMSPAYAKKYDDTFDRLVRPNAAKVRAKVEAKVKASGVAHADPGRVTVLLYVNQTTTSTANGGEPQVALNRVQLSMVERGGRWLVSDITSY